MGAGFGGLELVNHLRDVPVDVVLVDANNFHTFQPLLYQVATAGLDSDDIASPVRGIVAGHGNVDVRLGRVTGIDVGSRRLAMQDGPPVEYDQLVLAAGAVTATFGVPGVAEHGFGLKSLEDALRLRHHVLRQFERAAVDPGLIDDGVLNVVIAGGGPTGVELAGGLTELYRSVLTRDFPTLDVRRARVILVEPAGVLLSSFHPRLSERARRTLAARGVEVVLGQGVAGTDGKVVELTDGGRIPSPTLVWTAGVRANPLAEVLAEQLGEGRSPGGPGWWWTSTSTCRATPSCSSSVTWPRPPDPTAGRCPRWRRWPSRPAGTWPTSSPAAWRVGPPRRSATGTRGPWPPSAATTPWPSCRAGCASPARWAGWPGWCCTW